MRLSELKTGESALVLHVPSHSPALRRLMEMGLLPGTPVRLTRRAPLGDPLQILLRGYALTLRRREAAQVEVEKRRGDVPPAAYFFFEKKK